MAQKYWSRMGNRPPAKDNATCQVCGSSFHVKPSVLAKGKGQYCSRECFAAHQRTVRGEEHPLHGISRSQGIEKVCKGCGKTFVHRRSRVEYCSAACHHRANPPKPTAGHRYINAQGYVRLTLADGHRVLEHRHVYEQAHGVKLERWQIVHHINHVKSDNRIENLKLVTRAEHDAEHGGHLRWGAGRPNCPQCGKPKDGVAVVNGRPRKYCKPCNRNNVWRQKQKQKRRKAA